MSPGSTPCSGLRLRELVAFLTASANSHFGNRCVRKKRRPGLHVPNRGYTASVRTPAAVQFGVYEFDAETGELIKDGVRVRLQEQPAKVLQVFLGRPGELITREQLKQVLAPDTSFGDFDHALNVAVGKLRTALNDSADNPIYIETLPKRGYRFIAAVNGSVQADVPDHVATPEPDKPTVEAHRNRARLRWWMAAGIAALLLAAGIGVLWPHNPMTAVYEPVAFTTMQGIARQPAFSPDGSEVAFTWQSDASAPQRIYVQSIGSTVARPLTADDTEANRLEAIARWFHDGSRIAYIRQAGGKREVWTVARSGGQPRKLADLGNVRSFDIAPDDKSIITSEGPGVHAAALFLTSLDSKSRRQLTTPEDKQWAMSVGLGGDQFPLFSPDGKSVAYFHVESSRIDLLRISLADGKVDHLLDDTSSTAAQVPTYTWGADGKSLIVATVRHQNPSWGRLWIRGKRWEPLGITGTSYPTMPRDGARLAFVRATGFLNIWRYDLRPGHGFADATNITRSSSEDRGPALSPDGNRLTFSSNRTGSFEIFVSNSDGSNPVQLTSFGGKDTGTPRWSPDGKQIAFDYRPDGHSHIFAVDSNGGPARQLTSADADDVLPQYSQDGKWLYFARLREGGGDEWKIPGSGGAPVFVVANAISVNESADGKTLYLKHFDLKGIYARGIGDSKEELLCGGDITIGPWVVFGDGIYYQQRAPHHQLAFYDFASRTSRVLLDFPFPAGSGTTISISPDRRYYFEHRDERQSNIMLIESFR